MNIFKKNNYLFVRIIVVLIIQTINIVYTVLSWNQPSFNHTFCIVANVVSTIFLISSFFLHILFYIIRINGDNPHNKKYKDENKIANKLILFLLIGVVIVFGFLIWSFSTIIKGDLILGFGVLCIVLNLAYMVVSVFIGSLISDQYA